MPKNILVIGAGRSATSLIDYLANNASQHDWQIRVGDLDLALAERKCAGRPYMQALALDLQNQTQLETEVAQADLVVSLAPPALHNLVATCCLTNGAHLVTASYVSDEIRAMHNEAVAKGLIFLNEMGCDPGIDHMSAVAMIAAIKTNGGKITSFKSGTGGLVAPENDDNPWHYKFSWNPRNVVLAGQAGAVFKEAGQVRFLSYLRLFSTATNYAIPDLGDLEGYANRDSLPYEVLYGLDEVATLQRLTFRYPGFSRAWRVLAHLGLTQDTQKINLPKNVTTSEFLTTFLPETATMPVKQALEENLKSLPAAIRTDVVEKIASLGLFGNEPLPQIEGTPAQLLQALLEQKWAMQPTDRDMVVMQHLIEYTIDEKHFRDTETLIDIGTDSVHTSMAKLVGLPLAMGAKQILTGGATTTGVVMPTLQEYYLPVLSELQKHGVRFTKHTTAL